MYMKNNELFEIVDQYLYDCKDLRNWESKVPTHTPLGTFLSNNPYKSIPIELFHFTRNFLNHYLDKYTITSTLYIHLTCIFTMPNSISYTPFPILANPVILFIICVLFQFFVFFLVLNLFFFNTTQCVCIFVSFLQELCIKQRRIQR